MGRILPSLLPAWGEAPPLEQPRRGVKPRFTVEQVRACDARGLSIEATMAELGCSRATVAKLRLAAGIRKRAPRGQRSVSRHESRGMTDRAATMPAIDNPALSEARTLYPAQVVPPEGLLNILIRGENSWKIGGEITKGRWKGYPVYTLTLEERATCPTSCAHWRSCYGNHSNWAKRVGHGPGLEDRLGHELAILQYRHPGGFAVRLHVLGDFYSADYVELWRGFLSRFPALHVFGFTARIDGKSDPIASALVDLVATNWKRFAVRFSNAPIDEFSTVSIEHPLQKPADAIICPQQIGKTASCGTCGLCWATTRRIAFLRH